MKERDSIDLIKIYLAIPYRRMEQSSYRQSLEATIAIMRERIYNVFSPIVHSHPMTGYGIQGDWAFWSNVDYQYIDWCDEVWVLIPEEGMDRVYQSEGVNAEISYAKDKDKRIRHIKLRGWKDGITFVDVNK